MLPFYKTFPFMDYVTVVETVTSTIVERMQMLARPAALRLMR